MDTMIMEILPASQKRLDEALAAALENLAYATTILKASKQVVNDAWYEDRIRSLTGGELSVPILESMCTVGVTETYERVASGVLK